MTDEEWLTRDDMAEIRPGDRIEAEYRGLTIVGTAHHTGPTGEWRTEEGGELLGVGWALRWRKLSHEPTELRIPEGTVIIGLLDGNRCEVIAVDGAWADLNTGEPMPDGFQLTEWRVLSGSVTAR